MPELLPRISAEVTRFLAGHHRLLIGNKWWRSGAGLSAAANLADKSVAADIVDLGPKL